jgi:beta-glucosidase-like glycosyl hydrolase/CubicO group peptidase (beta-lactamase class C family)
MPLIHSSNGYDIRGGTNEQVNKNSVPDNWAEQQLSQMNLEQKIAQLLMIRMHSNLDPLYVDSMVAQIAKYQPGGVCFFQGGPLRELNITNKIQSISKIQLLVAIDGEWGVSMRLDSCAQFPRQMTLGALDSRYDSLIYQMGYEVGNQCKALGIHLNFAPDVDINCNPHNPVINSRSFGENRDLVIKKAMAYMKGMQQSGILTCIKHFPGHGDTGTDSHYQLPIINKSHAALDSLELYPFQQLINAGADMVMVAHLNVPAIDNAPNSIATLSYKTITQLLKEKMGFQGIVITDAMEMKGLRNYYPDNGEAEIAALLAGNDILLLPGDMGIIIEAIKQAVITGRISRELIDQRCLKILKLKQKIGLTHFEPISNTNIEEQMHGKKAIQLIQTIESKAITLLRNKNEILPLSPENNENIALLVIGGISDSFYLQHLATQWHLNLVQVDRSIKKQDWQIIDKKLSKNNTIITLILGTNQLPKKNYGIYRETTDYLAHLSPLKQLILSIHANPYSLPLFGKTTQYNAILMAYQPTMSSAESALNAIFGKQSVEGSLPVSVGDFSSSYGLPLTVGPLDCRTEDYSLLPLQIDRQIDSMVTASINAHIFPGCQVLAAKNGNILFSKSYGYLTYDSLASQQVSTQTIYDIASITKSAATTLAVMKLYEEKRFNLTDPIGKYLPFLSQSNKTNITIIELLTHTSGLKAFIPFYLKLATLSGWDNTMLSTQKSDQFPTKVADNIFIEKGYNEEMLKQIADSPLAGKKYVYSDLNFVLLKEMVETMTGMPLDRYVDSCFYQKMGLTNCFFNPLQHNIDKNRIAPTENDAIFRKQVVHGYVHDQTAACFGGVSGNAGLFCTANDLAQIFQMLLNGGQYNGTRYLSEKTVKLFTSTYIIHDCKRRALGFDTPDFGGRSGIIPTTASSKTFGHQGFTGTVVWCDPQSKTIYIFLSNRVFPNAEPNNLAKSKLRLRIHEKILEDTKR